MEDGTVHAAALKWANYTTAEEQLKANAELAALQDAEGCPCLNQCLAVFIHQDKRSGNQHLMMLLE